MKKNVVLLLTISLLLTGLSNGYTQDEDFDTRRASDVNADGFITINDVKFIASHFGATPPENQHPNPDINRDGIVNILDLVLTASYFGKTSGIPFEVTDATFDDIVLGSELPIVVEFKSEF